MEHEPGGIKGNHRLYTTKYGLEVLLGMKTLVSNSKMEDEKPKLRIKALAESESLASIILYDLAVKVKMDIM